MRRRLITIALASTAFVSLPVLAAEPAFPSKPITIVVGNAPGGSNDTFARAIARRLQDAMGQTVVVDNKPASQGIVGSTFVARAPADGYTLMVVSSTFTTAAAIQTNLPYDPLKSFTPVAILARGPLLFTVAANSPFKTLQELVAYAKANPEKLNYATSGGGSINNFATQLFTDSAGVKLTHIPYKGMAPAVVDLIAGSTQVLIASAPSVLTHVKSGRLRALAVTSGARSPVAPELPTLEDSGYKGASVDIWWGVMAPAGVPQPVIDRLNAELAKAVQGPEMREFFLREGAEPAAMPAADFARHVASEIARWKGVVQSAGIKAD